MPIDIATGNVELDREDFELPGRIPIKWIRSFRTHLHDKDLARMGRGWTTSWFPTFRRTDGQWIFTNRSGDDAIFEDPRSEVLQGKTLRLLDAFLELRMNRGLLEVLHWDVDTSEIERFVFQPTRAGVSYQLHEIQNVSGDAVQLQWDSMGRLESLYQKIEERRVLVRYTNSGQIDSLLLESDPAKKPFVRYEYDKSGRLMAAWNRRELAHRYEYDEQSRLKREMLPDGAIYSYRYDEKGRCIHFTGLDRYNEKKLRFLDPVGTTIVTNSYGQIRTYKSLPSGKIISEQSPTGATKQTNYDEYGRIVEKIDELGAVTKYTYDELGNRDSITDALGNITKFTYNDSHQPTLMIDAMGHPWKREYDRRERLIATVNPLGARWEFEYDSDGNPIRITDPQGYCKRITFRNGTIAEATDYMSNRSYFHWDVFGRLLRSTGPAGDSVDFKYDPNGNILQTVYSDGTSMHATYDAGDNLTSIRGSKGFTTSYSFGPCGRELERIDPNGSKVKFLWGSEPERLTAIINEKGERFEFAHDECGFVESEKSFSGIEHRFSYDAAGNCIAFTNARGEVIRYKYDELCRLIEQTLPNGAKTTFAYDMMSRMVSAKNDSTEVRFDYDVSGQLISEWQDEHLISTKYNPSGEIVQRQSSLGHNLNFELDANGKVTSISHQHQPRISFKRDERGMETERWMHGELLLKQDFDIVGRLKQQIICPNKGKENTDFERHRDAFVRAKAKLTFSRQYKYDSDGWLVAKADSRRGDTQFTYDPGEKLLGLTCGVGVELFEYDATGNIRFASGGVSKGPRQMTYGTGNVLQSCNSTIYEHDENGRRVKKTVLASQQSPKIWRYEWDALDQMTAMVDPDGIRWTYSYDAFGRRIAKSGPDTNDRFLWSGDSILHHIDGEKNVFTWVMEQDSHRPLAKIANGDFLPIVCDHLGTPQEMLDEGGNIVWEYTSTAWGERLDSQQVIGGVTCEYRFQGQWFDSETELHYNRHRYYDPEVGAFISTDGVGLIGGLNLYQYVTNPIGWIDPLGLTKANCTDTPPLSARAARRKVMREQGIPTSQQPVSQSSNKSGREYRYVVPKPGGGTTTKSVQQQTMDRSHPGQAHWEAGTVKTDPVTGDIRMNDHGRPKLQNDKSKVDYP